MRFGAFSLAAFLAAAPMCAGATQPTALLDGNAIHAAYNEGDFETVIARIDEFRRAHPAYPKDDSIFIAKHLAVVYTANPATREKGKHYMFLLLELLPSAKIVDMFVSEEIDRIFEKVKEEFAIRQKTPRNSPGGPAPAPGSAAGRAPANSPVPAAAPDAGAAEAKPAPRSHALYWALGGTAFIAATGAAAYFLMTEPHPKETVYDIPH